MKKNIRVSKFFFSQKFTPLENKTDPTPVAITIAIATAIAVTLTTGIAITHGYPCI